jgi:hypothetical protein
MTPVEILTLAPLGALVVVFGVFPGLILDLVAGSVAAVIEDVRDVAPIAIAPETAVIAIAIPIVYVVLRTIYVAYLDSREALEAGPASGAAR